MINDPPACKFIIINKSIITKKISGNNKIGVIDKTNI